jgi:Sigma-70 region 2
MSGSAAHAPPSLTRRASHGALPIRVFASRPEPILETDTIGSFEQQMLPHLGAAFTLARYLLRERADSEDAVQEAYLQALRYFRGFRGENARAWLLTIAAATSSPASRHCASRSAPICRRGNRHPRFAKISGA